MSSNNYFRAYNSKPGIYIVCGEAAKGKSLLMYHIISDILYNEKCKVSAYDNENCIQPDIVRGIFFGREPDPVIVVKNKDDIINERINAIVSGEIKCESKPVKESDKEKAFNRFFIVQSRRPLMDDIRRSMTFMKDNKVFLFGNLPFYFEEDPRASTREVQIASTARKMQSFFRDLRDIIAQTNVTFWIESQLARNPLGGGFVRSNAMSFSADAIFNVQMNKDLNKFHVDIEKSRIEGPRSVILDCRYKLN